MEDDLIMLLHLGGRDGISSDVNLSKRKAKEKPFS